MNRLKATYIGESEFGFAEGETYDIEINVREIQIFPLGETVSHIYVYNQNGFGWHPYKDEEEMMKNWRFE